VSVCLFVCLADYSKGCARVFGEICERVRHGPKTVDIESGGDLDAGILKISHSFWQNFELAKCFVVCHCWFNSWEVLR